eukprot:scaffold7614_cov417-Prasinococcus_capsulatus_cf.AAC.4
MTLIAAGQVLAREELTGAQLQDLRPLDELRSSFQPEQQGHRGRPDGVAKPSLPLLQLLKLYVLPVSPRYVSNVIITLLRGEYRLPQQQQQMAHNTLNNSSATACLCSSVPSPHSRSHSTARSPQCARAQRS